MTQTLTLDWYRSRLFAKPAPVAVIALPKFPRNRLHYEFPKKLKLPAVMLGCRLIVGEVAGMKAIRAGILLAQLNAHAAFLEGV